MCLNLHVQDKKAVFLGWFDGYHYSTKRLHSFLFFGMQPFLLLFLQHLSYIAEETRLHGNYRLEYRGSVQCVDCSIAVEVSHLDIRGGAYPGDVLQDI